MLQQHTSTVVLVLVLGLIITCTTVLSATGSATPNWFESLALLLAGAAAGVAQPSTPVVTTPQVAANTPTTATQQQGTILGHSQP